MLTLTEAYNGLAPGNYGISVVFTGTSDWIMLPSNMDFVSVAIHPAPGEAARVEFTLAGATAINGGTAVWMTWPTGNANTSANDALLTHASAIRGVTSGSGNATLEVLAT